MSRARRSCASASAAELLHDVLILAVKGLVGGLLVMAFALLSQGLKPKRFAGLFSAAPAVAIAGMIVVLLDKGRHDLHQNGVGMIAGGAGMVAYAAAAVALLGSSSTKRTAVMAFVPWLAVAAVASLPLLLG